MTARYPAEQAAYPTFSLGPRTLSHFALVRIHAQHTQASLAEAAGVSERTIQRLDKGARPSATTAVRVSRVLGHTDPLVVFGGLLERAPDQSSPKVEAAAEFTIEEHRRRTPSLSDSERLRAFHGLPQPDQDAASRAIREQADAEREGDA